MNGNSKYDRIDAGLRKIYEDFVIKYFKKSGFPPESIIILGFKRLSGSVANTLLVDLHGLSLVLKHDPATVPREIKALKALNKKFPDYFPKLLHYDQKQGILLMPFYPYLTLHEMIMDPEIPDSVKIRCFKRAYEVLHFVIYESTLREGISDPIDVHIRRIERAYRWADRKGMRELVKKEIKVDGQSLGTFLEHMDNLMRRLDQLICYYRTIILGDEHLKNILVSLSPPGSRIIFFDLPNVNLDGEEPAKGWAKILQWIMVGHKIYELNSSSLEGEELDKKVKETLNLSIEPREETVEISYELYPMPLANKLKEVFEGIVNGFAKRHDDQRWKLRLLLGEARANFGAVIHQRSKYLSIILFVEGMKNLKELSKLLD